MNLPMAERQGSTGAFARRVSEYETGPRLLRLDHGRAGGRHQLPVPVPGPDHRARRLAGDGADRRHRPDADRRASACSGRWARPRSTRRPIRACSIRVLVESIGGIETLKAARAEGQMLGRWRRYSTMTAATQERMRRLTAVAVNLASVSQQLISVGLLIGGFYLFNAGNMSMGAIIAIVMLAGRALAPIGQFAFLITRGAQAIDDARFAAEDDGGGRRAAERGAQHRSRNPRRARSSSATSASAIPMRPAIRCQRPQPEDQAGRAHRRSSAASRRASRRSAACCAGSMRRPTATMPIDGLDSRQYHPHQIRDSVPLRRPGRRAVQRHRARQSDARRGAGRRRPADRRRGALGRRHLPVARCRRLRPSGRRARIAPVGRAARACWCWRARWSARASCCSSTSRPARWTRRPSSISSTI